MNLKGLVPLTGVVISSFFANRLWLEPFLLAAGIALSIPVMYGVGKKYDGFVGAMSLPHLLLTMPATILIFNNVVDNSVTPESEPIFFYWSCAQLTVFGLSHVLDAWTVFNWHVLKNLKVLRCTKHVRAWQKRGKLPQSTSNVQLIMQSGNIVDNQCDEFGFLK